MKRNKTDILPNFVVLKMYKYYGNTKFPWVSAPDFFRIQILFKHWVNYSKKNHDTSCEFILSKFEYYWMKKNILDEMSIQVISWNIKKRKFSILQ